MSFTNLFAFLIIIISSALFYYKHFYKTNTEFSLRSIEFKDGKLEKIDTVDIALLGGIAFGILWLVGKFGLSITFGGVSIDGKDSKQTIKKRKSKKAD